MNPVDPGAALFGIDRAGRAEHDHRHAVAPGVEQAHHAVQEPDIAVQHASHRLAGRLGIAVRDRHRMVLVQAHDDPRPLVAEMIDQAVVQTTVARAWVEADIRDAQPAEHLRGDIAAPSDLVVRLSFNSKCNFAFSHLVQGNYALDSWRHDRSRNMRKSWHATTPSGTRRPERLSHRAIFCLHDREKKWNRAIIRSRGLVVIRNSGGAQQSGVSYTA